MSPHTSRPAAAVVTVLLAAVGCSSQAVPSSSLSNASTATTLRSLSSGVQPLDSKSILDKLTKNVTIGSTIDPQNGDKGPRNISIATGSKNGGPDTAGGKLTKGQLLVCNYADSAGVQGNGTTLEVLNPTPNSTPVRFSQSPLIKGCDGDAIQPRHGSVWATGFTSKEIVEFAPKGAIVRKYQGAKFGTPLGDTVADHTQDFGPLNVYVGVTAQGGIYNISAGFYGNGLAVQVAKGFPVGNSNGEELGPGAFQYNLASDTLYIVDGDNNTIVAFSNASKLVAKDEIIVEDGGTKFKCKYAKTTCGRVIFSGSPLDAPIAAALLPNGNLIVANSRGTANTLVELMPTGKVLATKVVDTTSAQGVYGIAASGTNDNNTVLFYTDMNSNTVQELEQ